MKILKNGPIRAIAYILIFAGLLKITAMLFALIWNDFLVINFNLPPMNVLESVGVLAFIYLVYTGIKFGFNAINDKFLSQNSPSGCDNCQHNKASISFHHAKMLSKEEKDQLQQAIAKCCGINHESRTAHKVKG